MLRSFFYKLYDNVEVTNSTSFFLLRMIVLPTLAGFLTWYWIDINFILKLRAVDTIFFGGIFFSFAITINTANIRRFQAIEALAKLWAVSMSIWHTLRLELTQNDVDKLADALGDFFEKIRLLLHIDTLGDDRKAKLAEIDDFFYDLTNIVYQLRDNGLNSPETACLWKWIEEMNFAMERLLSIKDNRTPKSLRIFIDWALVCGMLLLTPLFASYGNYGILISIIIMVVLLFLIKVQKMLEHPFGKDMDDIDLRCRDKINDRFGQSKKSKTAL
jgi:Bestrophin, RFP-TM, chloride channel